MTKKDERQLISMMRKLHANDRLCYLAIMRTLKRVDDAQKGDR